MSKCTNCNGSGVFQEYDEFDRYHVLECSRCNGSGVINTEELKPCPFCGGEAGITWDKWQDDELYCCVECDCGVSTGVYEDLDEAVEAWNKRTLLEDTLRETAIEVLHEQAEKFTTDVAASLLNGTSTSDPVGILGSQQEFCPICKDGDVQGLTIEGTDMVEVKTHDASYCWRCGEKIKTKKNEVALSCRDCGYREITSKRKSLSMDGKRCPGCKGPLFLIEDKEAR